MFSFYRENFWYENEIDEINFDFYFEIFKKQHIKYTPQCLVDSLEIDNFEEHLSKVWEETKNLIKSGTSKIYDLMCDHKVIGFIIGSKDSNIFRIRHFNHTEIEKLNPDIFNDFCSYVCVNELIIRSRKGIPKYKELILSWGFNKKEENQDYEFYNFYLKNF